VTLDRGARNLQLGKLSDQPERKLGPLPVFVDHREHVVIGECTNPVSQLALGSRQGVVEPVVVVFGALLSAHAGGFSHRRAFA
jgi:hypothetical protein